MYMSVSVTGLCAVGFFAEGHLAVRHFDVRLLRRKDISPWRHTAVKILRRKDISPQDFFAVWTF